MTRGMAHVSRGFLGNLLITAVALAVALVLLELAARWMLSDIGTTGDRNTYLSQRWYSANPPQNNRLGFREREFSVHAAAGVTRIALVGDSFTYAPGIAEADRISNRLERKLDATGASYEVLNFGQPGANFEEHLTNLRIALDSSHPDYVLLQLYLNDFDDPNDQRPRPSQLGSVFHHYLSRLSALYFLGTNAFVTAQLKLGLIDVDAYYARFLNPADPIASRARARLLKVINAARDSNRPFGLFIWPELTRPLDTSPNDRLIDEILAICRAEHIECIDLRIALRGVTDHQRLIVNRFDTHASAQANWLAADLIAERLGKTWSALGIAARPVQSEDTAPHTP
jgi:hypothetical protein